MLRQEVRYLQLLSIFFLVGECKKPVTHGWWEGFIKRHPYLTVRTAAPLSCARAISSDPDVINRYFDLLEQTLKDNGLEQKPCNIFNMDETGMPLDPKPLKTIHRKGEKNPVAIGSGLKTQITVVDCVCVSAGGYCLPPMVIWDRKCLKPELTVGEVPGTIYGLSKKGWIDQELFDAWFNFHFFGSTLRWHAPFYFSWMDTPRIIVILCEWLQAIKSSCLLCPQIQHT